MDLEAKTIIAAAVLALLWLGEGWIPFYAEFGRDLKGRLKHDTKNLVLGVLNAALVALVFGGGFAVPCILLHPCCTDLPRLCVTL